MLGLITLGLMLIMIYGLVSLAVKGKVASPHHVEKNPGTLSVCMILKDQHTLTPLQLENNLNTVASYPGAELLLMVQGLEAEVHAYEDMQKRYPMLKVFMVPNHPQVTSVSGWMMQELLKIAKGDYLLLLHSQLDLDLTMLESSVTEARQTRLAIYGLAQIKRDWFLSESVLALTPQLLISSLKIPKSWKKNIRLASLSDYTNYFLLITREQLKNMGSTELSLKGPISPLVEEFIQKDELKFMYGEKHLVRRVPVSRALLQFEVRQLWQRLISSQEKAPLIIFIAGLIVWSFPWMFVLTHPYWALVGFLLLGIYRFFTKIVFQESWPNIILHPAACVFWWYGLAQVLCARRKA